MNELCIQTHKLNKQFGAKLALNDFSLDIQQGGIHAIVGSNGAGKSTLFRILLGFETPNSGSSSLFGEDSQQLSTKLRGQVGFVNEEHSLPLWMTVEAVKQMQQKLYSNWNESVYNNIFAYFEIEPKQKISGLSRGERAGLKLSIALAQSPKLLLLDEPTLGLDIVARRAFLEALMFTENEANTTTIYCSHQLDEVERIAERLIIMEKGQLKNNSTPDEFCLRVNYWVTDWDDASQHLDGIPGLLSHREIEGQQHIIVVDQDQSFSQFLSSKGAVQINKLPVNLSNAVNSFLTANHKHKPNQSHNQSAQAQR